MKHAAQLQKAKADKLSRVAVKLFFNICNEWKLKDKHKLVLAGQNSRTTLHTWNQKLEAGEPIKLTHDTLERLSYIAGIYKALQLLLPTKAQWQEWVHKPNQAFGGESALDRMMGGNVVDLADVRRYLDAHRGALYE